MSLKELNIHDLRNIAKAQLTLHPRFNIVHGLNGSGKTSVLESVYLLGTGHSFSTRETAALVRFGEAALTVFGRNHLNETISIQKLINGTTRVKINQQACHRSSELAYFLPCQVFYQDIFQIIDEGPAIRRSLLDWGLFHVKPDYLEIWKHYRRVIKQRNALLRQKASQQQFNPWNDMLVELATALDLMRQDYCQQWNSHFQIILPQLTDMVCTMHYFKGWDKKETGKSLNTLLSEQYLSDIQSQYTHSGAHQADLYFQSFTLKAKQSLSRGQQKIILIALKLAQSQLLNKTCVYLFDDITAELDANHIQRLISYLKTIDGQFLLTTINPENLIKLLDNQEMSDFAMTTGCFT